LIVSSQLTEDVVDVDVVVVHCVKDEVHDGTVSVNTVAAEDDDGAGNVL